MDRGVVGGKGDCVGLWGGGLGVRGGGECVGLESDF
jgi:hypothetical protein